MYRRITISVWITLAALAVLAIPAFAGGVVVSLDNLNGEPEAGEPFRVTFTVYSMHTGDPAPGLYPNVTATNPKTGEEIQVIAQAEGAPGHYLAELAFPSAGQWEWQIQPFGREVFDYPASTFTPFQVKEAAHIAAPALDKAGYSTAQQGSTEAGNASFPILTVSALMAGLALASIAIFISRQRGGLRVLNVEDKASS